MTMKNLDETAATENVHAVVDERTSRVAELTALRQLEEVLGGMTAESVERILRWYGESRGVQNGGVGAFQPAVDGSSARGRQGETNELPDLFDRANPRLAPERALIVAYWLQVVQGTEEFDSQRVNTELKNLGFPSSNITADFTRLSKRTPSEARQVRKEGRSNQARKKYRLTREGIRRAEVMLAGGESRDEHH